MTSAPARLRLMQQAETPVSTAAPAQPADRFFTAVPGIVPDDGRLAHPATHTSTQDLPRPLSRAATENELVGFVCDLLQAPAAAVGTVASGLADSALLVVRGARASRPTLRRPTMVLPATAHPAWFAAAATVGLIPVVVPVDAEGRVQVGPVTAAITEDTVLVVASAPSYTHGTVDPIAWIAAATSATGIALHVDASSGGWTLAYAEITGRVRQPWGFAVPGVTSVTIDAGPERGTDADLSILLHRTAAHRRPTRLAAIGPHGSLEAAVPWAPPGALLAEVAETLREIGHQGCAELAVDALDATARIVDGLADARGVHLVSRPDATTISLRSEPGCDIFVFADALHHRGWTAQPVLPEVGPPLVRLPVTAAMLPLVEQCLVAVHDAIADARRHGRAEVDRTLERLLARLDPADVSERSAVLLLDAAAVLDAADTEHPERRCATNLLIRAAAPGVREVLVTAHHDRGSVPVRRGTPRLIGHDEDDG